MIYKIHILPLNQIKRFIPNSKNMDDYTLQNERGIYFLFEDSIVVYIGKSDDLFRRLHKHNIYDETKITSVGILPIVNKFEMDIAEMLYIHKLKPKYNKQYKYLDEDDVTEIFI